MHAVNLPPSTRGPSSFRDATWIPEVVTVSPAPVEQRSTAAPPPTNQPERPRPVHPTETTTAPERSRPVDRNAPRIPTPHALQPETVEQVIQTWSARPEPGRVPSPAEATPIDRRSQPAPDAPKADPTSARSNERQPWPAERATARISWINVPAAQTGRRETGVAFSPTCYRRHPRST